MMNLERDLPDVADALKDSATELRLIGKENNAVARELAASIVRGFLRLPASKQTEIQLLGIGIPSAIVKAMVEDVELKETPVILAGFRICQN